LPGEASSSHGLDINAFVGPFRIAFAKFLRQNCTNRGLRLQVGNNGNASGQKVREVVQRVPPLAQETATSLRASVPERTTSKKGGGLNFFLKYYF
jgi:hypothetical protein